MFSKIAKLAIATLMISVCGLAQAQSSSTVLVVGNANNAQSIALAKYYMAARKVPAANLLLLNWAADDNAYECKLDTYTNDIAKPVYDKIKTLKQIDYIVLCRNLPTRIVDSSFAYGANSVDSCLAINSTKPQANPYRSAGVHFTAARYGMRLVTRLDGWSWEDAKALVDNSLAAKKATRFHAYPYRSIGSAYQWWNDCMDAADKILDAHKMNSTVGSTIPTDPLMGFTTWGSNGYPFHFETTYGVVSSFEKLIFLPGSIAETAVSTSGLYLRCPPASKNAQSQVAQLIHRGVTGVKGYVAEPYLSAMAQPDLLMGRYVVGYNLAESFYGASSWIGWKDMVIGDPLCNPFKK